MNKNMNKDNFTPEQMAMAQNAMKNAKDIFCKCGGGIFTQSLKLKRVSKLLIGADEDAIVPIPVLTCILCKSEINTSEESEPDKNEIVLNFKDRL